MLCTMQRHKVACSAEHPGVGCSGRPAAPGQRLGARTLLHHRRRWQLYSAQDTNGASTSGQDGASGRNSSSNSNGASASSEEDISRVSMPKIGYFSLADPKAEVYSKAGEVFDPKKKGGRFKPEFIWNTNWQEALKRQEDLERQQMQYQQGLKEGSKDGAAGPGVVSFSRLSALDDMSVDLTQQLLRRDQTATASSSSSSSTTQQQRPAAPARAQQQQQLQQQQSLPAARPSRQRPKGGASPSYQYKDLPTRAEAVRFNRATKSAIRSAPTTTLGAVGKLPPEEAERQRRLKEAERVKYEALKLEFQLWTVALGTLGSATAYAAYSNDTAISYGLGAVAGLTYLRLLSRSVDAVGDASLGATIQGAGAQPRLLIPVLLALAYNRWNTLYAPTAGVTLQLLPMLVGFFTYKFAVLARQGLALLKEVSDGSSGSSTEAQGQQASDDGQGDGGAMTLDRIFVKRALSE